MPRTILLQSSGVLSCAVLLLSVASGAHAQDTDQPPPDEEIEDVITVNARGVNDYAMDAFRRGDFVTAEIEFLANARCALRRERNLAANVESAQRASTRNDVTQQAQSGAEGATTPGGGAGAGATPPPSASSSPSATNGVQTDREAPIGRSCDDRGFQMYMTGLSQLQLGKIDDALKSFQSAVAQSKVLYDAHYRIALIALLRDDSKTAERQIKRIETILRRCGSCDAREEIEQRRDHLVKALNNEVSLN